MSSSPVQYVRHGLSVKEDDNVFYYFSYPKNPVHSDSPSHIRIKRVTLNVNNCNLEDSCHCVRVDDYTQNPSTILEKFPAFVFIKTDAHLDGKFDETYDINGEDFAEEAVDFKMQIQFLGESVKYGDPDRQKRGWQVYEIPDWDNNNTVPCKRLHSSFMKVGNKGYLYGGFVSGKLVDLYNEEGDYNPKFFRSRNNCTERLLVNDLWEFDFVHESWKLLVPAELRPIDEFDFQGAPFRMLSRLPESELKAQLDVDMYKKNYKRVTSANDGKRQIVNYQGKHRSCVLQKKDHVTIQAFDEVQQRIFYIGWENHLMLRAVTVSIFDCKQNTLTILPTYYSCEPHTVPLTAIYNPTNDTLFVNNINLGHVGYYCFSFETGLFEKSKIIRYSWKPNKTIEFVDGYKSIASFVIDEPNEVLNTFNINQCKGLNFNTQYQNGKPWVFDEKKESIEFDVFPCYP